MSLGCGSVTDRQQQRTWAEVPGRAGAGRRGKQGLGGGRGAAARAATRGAAAAAAAQRAPGPPAAASTRRAAAPGPAPAAAAAMGNAAAAKKGSEQESGECSGHDLNTGPTLSAPALCITAWPLPLPHFFLLTPSAPSPCLSKVRAQGPQNSRRGPLAKGHPPLQKLCPPTQLSLPAMARMTAGAPHGALSLPYSLLSWTLSHILIPSLPHSPLPLTGLTARP